MSEQLQRQTPQTLGKAIESRMASFGAVATKYLTPERLVKLAQLAISKNPGLAECSTLSVLECLMTCAKLGLEPNEPGGVWLVPFKGVCTAIVDYRGMVDVARRSGAVLAVHADIRYAKDVWSYSIDTSGPTIVNLKHSPADGDRGPVLGAFFVAKLAGGECQAVYIDKVQIDQFRERSKADRAGFSPWKSDYNAMAIKTACRRGVNLLPKTPELQALREAIHAEDHDMALADIEIPEANHTAIERMLAAIGERDKALADGIHAGFESLGYGPARRLQLLTRDQAHPDQLLAWLRTEQARALPAANGNDTKAAIETLRGGVQADVSEPAAGEAAQEPAKKPRKRKPAAVEPEPNLTKALDDINRMPAKPYDGASF